MLGLGLTPEAMEALQRTLLSTHTRRLRVRVTDLEHTVTGDVSNAVIGGEVTVDANAEITRVCTLSLLDPDHAIRLDTEDPDDGVLFLDRMIEVSFDVRVEEIDEVINVPLFVGPIVKFSREADVIEVEAHGKEALATGSLWQTLNIAKNSKITDGIRRLLVAIGETRHNVPDLAVRVPAAKNLGKFTVPWTVITDLASNFTDRYAFYDAEGRFQIKHLGDAVAYTFYTYDDPEHGALASVLTVPSLSYDITEVKNAVTVDGHGKVTETAVAPDDHALAPHRLGRNGKGGYRGLRVKKKNLRRAAARRHAQQVLDNNLRAAVTVAFDAIPMFLLEPNDLVKVQTHDWQAEFRLEQFSFPLANENGAMSVGYVKNTKINRVKIREAG